MNQVSKTEEAFLELMRCGIWGTEPDTAFFSQLESGDWMDIYKIAGKQTVLGICLQSIVKLPDPLKPKANLLIQWVGASRYIEAKTLQKLQVWKELDKEWTAAGFRPVVFKGLSVAQWYANPLSRQFSDIDVYIPERFEELLQLLKDKGIQSEHKPQHDTIVYKGVAIEIHPRIINVPCKPSLGCEIIEEKISDDQIIRIPQLDLYSLILLSHAGGHFLVPGIGYRFLCDWAVFLKHNHDKIDVNLVLQESRRMGMIRFVTEFTRLAQEALGLEFEGLERWTEGSQPFYLNKLARCLFDNGDFGAVNFKDHQKKNPFTESWESYQNLSAFKYYWPKLYWKVAPSYLFKHTILVLLRYFGLRKQKE